MPWYKTLSRLHRDADYMAMPLAQQAVYRNLLDYANEQRERGSFSIKNTRVLALAVSMGDEQLLKDTLAYASGEWTCEDGTTSIVIDGDTARFSQWARIQKSYPSDEPEAVAERVRKHRSKQSNEHVTSESAVTGSLKIRGDIDGEGDREEDGRGRGESEGGRAPSATAVSPRPSEVDQVLDMLDTLLPESVPRTDVTTEGVWRTLTNCAAVDPLEVATDYVVWQETLPPKKRHRDVVKGWRNQMRMRRDNPQYSRPPDLSDDAEPEPRFPRVPLDLLERTRQRIALIEANSANGHQRTRPAEIDLSSSPGRDQR